MLKATGVDLAAPPDGRPIEYLGIPNCYAVPVPENRVEDDIVAHFVRAVRGQAPLHCGLDVGMHIAEQQQMAYQSARTGPPAPSRAGGKKVKKRK